MLAIQNVNLVSLLDTLVSLSAAVVLGGLIGDRQAVCAGCKYVAARDRVVN